MSFSNQHNITSSKEHAVKVLYTKYICICLYATKVKSVNTYDKAEKKWKIERVKEIEQR